MSRSSAKWWSSTINTSHNCSLFSHSLNAQPHSSRIRSLLSRSIGVVARLNSLSSSRRITPPPRAVTFPLLPRILLLQPLPFLHPSNKITSKHCRHRNSYTIYPSIDLHFNLVPLCRSLQNSTVIFIIFFLRHSGQQLQWNDPFIKSIISFTFLCVGR